MDTIIENELVKELANKHGRTRESLIPILQDLVVHKRYLAKQDMVDVARELDMSAADVFGTATFEEILKLNLGETTPDRKFSLLEANCIGWCHKAPAMLINDTPYTELSPEKVTEILREYIKK